MAAAPVMTPAEALAIVAQYLDQEWPQTREEDVTVTRLAGGVVNSLQVVRRSNWTASSCEPAAVIVRHYGQSDENIGPNGKQLTRAEQVLLTYEMSRRGWGPHLYGVFPTGRVEEYIQSHSLTATESESDPLIVRDMAKTYARFASLDLPFVKNKVDRCWNGVIRQLQGIRDRKEEIVSRILAIDHPAVESLAEMAFAHDWVQEAEWVQTLFEKFDCQRAFNHCDSNFNNILVRESVGQSVCKTLLVDYETAMHGYRGNDIGSHFAARMFDWTHPEDQTTGVSFPNADQRRSFCESYMEEWQLLGREVAPADSVDKLMLEAEVGVLFFALSEIKSTILHPEPASIPATKLAIDLYHKTKAGLLTAH